MAYLLLVGLTLLQMIGCSPAARQGAVNAIGAAGAGAAPSRQQKLMLFGGEGHKVYLGCLNCSQYSTDSVFNQYGTFGSRYSNTSIWNHYSDYGSAYSSWGACNPYATDPPVIVDLDGSFYVSRNIAVTDFANLVHAPEHLADPLDGYMEYLRSSNKLVAQVYEFDKAGDFRDAGSRDAFDFTTQRLAAGSQMLANLWYTAWLDSAN